MARIKWTIEIEVDETWVADGFDATADRVLAWLESDLQFATLDELGAKVLKRPSDEQMAKLQGFRSVAEYLHVRGKGVR